MTNATFSHNNFDMAWSGKTRHKLFEYKFYSPSVLYNVEFGCTNSQNDHIIELLLDTDDALSTSSLSSSSAIVRSAKSSEICVHMLV